VGSFPVGVQIPSSALNFFGLPSPYCKRSFFKQITFKIKVKLLFYLHKLQIGGEAGLLPFLDM